MDKLVHYQPKLQCCNKAMSWRNEGSQSPTFSPSKNCVFCDNLDSSYNQVKMHIKGVFQQSSYELGYFVSHCFCTKGWSVQMGCLRTFKFNRFLAILDSLAPKKGLGCGYLIKTISMPSAAIYDNTYHLVPTGGWKFRNMSHLISWAG